MQHFRGGSEFHKYKSILAPDQSQIIFTSIKATKCVKMPIYVFLQQLPLIFNVFDNYKIDYSSLIPTLESLVWFLPLFPGT